MCAIHQSLAGRIFQGKAEKVKMLPSNRQISEIASA